MAGPGRDDDHDEEVRFALVLNGRVSLAIWMGGVTPEIDRLTRTWPGADSGHERVLALGQARARADVIAGTSAGGINGGFLALGQAYEYSEMSGCGICGRSREALPPCSVAQWGPVAVAAAWWRLLPARVAQGLRGSGAHAWEQHDRSQQAAGRCVPQPRSRWGSAGASAMCSSSRSGRWSTNRFTFSRNPSALRRPGTADQQDVGEATFRRRDRLALQLTRPTSRPVQPPAPQTATMGGGIP
jgi:hypothetical protein